MPRIPISELPARFFDVPAAAELVEGFLEFEGDPESVHSVKIRTSSLQRKYKDIEFVFSGAIGGRFHIHIHDHAARLKIGGRVSGSYLFKLWGNASIEIGEHTTANSLEVWVEDACSVKVGEDCLIAHDVVLLAGDMHGIFDVEKKEQINNQPSQLLVGNHVWLGRKVTAVKSARIGNGCIVATGAVVSSACEDFCAIGGVPAVVLKRGVSWTRSRTCNEKEMNSIVAKYGS